MAKSQATELRLLFQSGRYQNADDGRIESIGF